MGFFLNIWVVIGALEVGEIRQMATACGMERKMVRQNPSTNQHLGVYLSGFSKEAKQIRCFYRERKLCYKEFAQVILEAEKAPDLPSISWSSEEPMV